MKQSSTPPVLHQVKQSANAKIKVQNALIIQTAFIGDTILTTSMLQAFKQHYPQARLTLLLKSESAELLREHPTLAEILVMPKKRKQLGIIYMLRLSKMIHARKFDILLAPHKSHRTALLALLSRIPYRVGYNAHRLARLSYHKCLQRDMQKPEIERLLEFLQQALRLAPFAFKKYHRPSLQVSASAYQKAKELLAARHIANAPIVLASSSVWPTKQWPSWYFAILAGKLLKTYKRDILLIGTAQERAVCAKVMYFVKNFQPPWFQKQIHDVSGQLNLPEVYALLTQSALLVSNDSAPVHLACAAGIPVVAIFGPTVPALGYAPLTKNSRVAEQKELSCRPCGLHGHKRCPQQHFRCMKDLTPLMVLERIKQAWPPKSSTGMS